MDIRQRIKYANCILRFHFLFSSMPWRTSGLTGWVTELVQPSQTMIFIQFPTEYHVTVEFRGEPLWIVKAIYWVKFFTLFRLINRITFKRRTEARWRWNYMEGNCRLQQQGHIFCFTDCSRVPENRRRTASSTICAEILWGPLIWIAWMKRSGEGLLFLFQCPGFMTTTVILICFSLAYRTAAFRVNG